jgi:hypothetical protein
MTEMNYTRRDLLGGFSVTAMMLGAFGTTAHAAPAPTLGTTAGLPDLNDPLVNLHGFMKLHGSLDEVDCPWWYTGLVYGLQDNTAPKPLFRFEGCEINHYRPNPNGDGYLQSGRTLTFFRDLETGAMLTAWTNPYNNKVVQPKSNKLAGNDSYLLSTQGLRFKEQFGTVPDQPLKLNWNVSGDMIWLIKDRAAPRAFAQPWLECSSTFGLVKEFADPKVKRADAWFTSTFWSPWMPWMDMKDVPGHVVWHASGRKLKTVEDLPPEYLARARKEAPEQLNATPPK